MSWTLEFDHDGFESLYFTISFNLYISHEVCIPFPFDELQSQGKFLTSWSVSFIVDKMQLLLLLNEVLSSVDQRLFFFNF